MKSQLLHTGPMGTNTYVISGAREKECAVIDPAGAEPVLSYCKENGLVCTHILLTHGHFDHIMGVADLREATGAKVCMSREDAPSLTQEDGQASRGALWGYSIKPSPVDVFVEDGEVLEAAGFIFKVITTPGHTPGGVCYVLDKPEKVIFGGDTLFRANVGRVDFPGGSAQALHASITQKLFALEGDYVVYTGHDEGTTLDYERRFNPYVTRWSPEEW